MSIKGLTDRHLSFPEIGQIRKGAKKSENAPGKDLDYFRVEFDQKETATAGLFQQKYGMQPTEINILLPFNEIERCWDAWLEAYTAGRMVARADGEKYLYRLDNHNQVMVRNGEPLTPYIEGEVVATYVNQKTKKTENVICKPVGRLKVIIPELGRLAFLTVMTTSVHDISNLSAQLEALKRINNGRLAGIPMILRRRPKPISVPKADGSRARYTKWMLSIEADPEFVKAKLLEVKHLALPGNGLALLPAPAAIPPIVSNHVEEEVEPPSEEEEWEPPSEPIEEGEFEDEPQPKTQPAKPEKLPLRYQPEQLKARLEEIAKDFSDPIKPERLGLIVVCLEQALSATGDPKLNRQMVQKYLTGQLHANTIPNGMAWAIFKWLNPGKNGSDWVCDEMAGREARAVLAVCQPTQETML